VEVITEFARAAARLARRPSFGEDQLPPAVQARLKAIFGREISPAEAVNQILSEVKKRGDAAVFEYTARIDGFRLLALEVDRSELKKAYRQVAPDLVPALNLAAERIRRFHQAQKERMWRALDGPEWGQQLRPLARVGLYAPGGTASYPSTVLMVAVPARVAGVKEVILATPPRSQGGLPPATLVAADIAGVDRVFAMGGAQAIGALAYGSESVPAVDKICGPGNLFVTLAKKAVFGTVDIDALQGPSEVLIIADAHANPAGVAADLLAQAEHDPQARVVLITSSAKLARAVQRELEAQLSNLSRGQIAAACLAQRGLIVIVSSLKRAIDLANSFAPEHLELNFRGAEEWLDRIQNAGCVFVGEDSAEALGDYVAGPNHSLPTGGTARFSSPLNILDYVKLTNVVKLNQGSLRKLGPAAITIARSEGLEAHARAVEVRLKKLNKGAEG
jgi:histidinol dehydrogenase